MIISFLSHFQALGGQYVSWKNNHEIHEVLAGNSDLDIFVPIQFKEIFLRLTKELSWIQVVNPIADYPEIYHFYNIDRNLCVFHLHVYFKVITGESWLKEYEFPLDDFLIDNRIQHSSSIYILNARAQSFLFALRHFIKGSSFFSRFLYKKELSSYQNEWDLCKDEFNPNDKVADINFSEYIGDSGLIGDRLNLPNTITARTVRKKISKFLRYPESKLGFLRLQNLGNRFFNKFFYKRKKILPYTGFILVFSGADGVGKSTMSETIGNTYKRFLTVRNVQLGRPQSRWVEMLRKMLNKQEKRKSGNSVDSVNNEKKMTLKRAIGATYLAYLRYATAKKAQKFKRNNYLIISDRWPTLEYHKMDGPKLNINTMTGLYKKLAVIEKQYYDKLAFSDLSIILTVPVEVAIQRNRDRVKEGKETDEEIKERHLQNANHNPKSKEVIRFDNNGSLNEKRYELIELIQSRLCK